MARQNRQTHGSISRWLLLAGIAASLGLSGCSWIAETMLINTLDREKCDTQGLNKVERVRKFEEEFLRQRDREASGFID